MQHEPNQTEADRPTTWLDVLGMAKPRVIGDALIDLNASDRWCTCCQKPISGRFAWLELDQRTDTYHDRKDIPEDNSQGWFPFGMTCAQNKLKEADSKTHIGAARGGGYGHIS